MWLDVFEGTTVIGMYPQRDKVDLLYSTTNYSGKKKCNIDINKKGKPKRKTSAYIFFLRIVFFIRVTYSDTVKECAVLRSKFWYSYRNWELAKLFRPNKNIYTTCEILELCRLKIER